MSDSDAAKLAENEKLIQQTKKYSPQLGELFDRHISLSEYSASLYNFNPPAEYLRRQELIKKKLTEKIEKLFGRGAIKKLKINFSGVLAFNIADHHQVLNHPFLISSNVISSVNKFLQPKKSEAIVVISSGDVPPNNFFGHNGFTFHGRKVPIFSNSERESVSYYISKRDFNFIEKLKLADRWREFTSKEQEFLLVEHKKISGYDYSRCDNYNDQISVIIKNTWPALFAPEIRENLPELIYITQEELVTECLIELLAEDNILSRCLFNPAFRTEILNNFRGIVVTWKESEQKGTHFFWRKYPGRSQSLRLYLKDNSLVPTDERFKDLAVSLDRPTIIKLLKNREIYPSLFMIFGVLNFYAGVNPLSGYGSITYLHLMKEAWLKTLSKFNLTEEYKLLETVEAKSLVAGLALFFKRKDGKLKTLYANDIFYDGGISAQYLQTVFKMDFADFLSVSAVDMYDYLSQKYIPPEEKMHLNINSDDLAEIRFNWL